MQIQGIDNVFCRVGIQPDAAGDVWFLHGFGASSYSFMEAFDSPLADRFNLYAIDFPGFGVSPQAEPRDLPQDEVVD